MSDGNMCYVKTRQCMANGDFQECRIRSDQISRSECRIDRENLVYVLYGNKRGITDKALFEKTPLKKLVASYMTNRWNRVPRRM